MANTAKRSIVFFQTQNTQTFATTCWMNYMKIVQRQPSKSVFSESDSTSALLCYRPSVRLSHFLALNVNISKTVADPSKFTI